MNQTFLLPRFGRLLRKYFTDNRGQLGVNVALLAVVLIALACIFYSDNPSAVDRSRSIPFFFVGWVAWYIFIWQQTEPLNHKERAMTYLMQPASQMEKIVLIWFVSGIGFMLAFLLVFGLIDATGVQYVNSREWNPAQLEQIKGAGNMLSIKPFYQSDNFWPPAHILVLTGLLHPFSLASLLILKQYSLPLVGVLIIVLIPLGYFLNTYLAHWFLNIPEVNSALPFEGLFVNALAGSGSRRIDLPQPIGDQLRYVVGITVVVLLYITAYFRLNEREV